MGKDKGAKTADSRDVRRLEDGRFVVEDLEDLEQGKKGRRAMRAQAGDDDVLMDDDDDDDDDESGSKGLSFGRGIHRDRKNMAHEEALLEAAEWGDTAYDGEFGDSDNDGDDDDDDGEGGELRSKRAKQSKKQLDAGKGVKNKGKGAAGLGAEFRSKKAAGDMRKKGQAVQSFAYLPMDPSMLNKRKRTKAESTFKNIIKSAKKGAKKGQKQARRQAKK